jgi:ParB family chromosome partitioning protein
VEPDQSPLVTVFAHCISLTVNAVSESYNRRPKAIAHADHVAQAVALDMAVAGWRPTVDNYLDRITEGRIFQAVSEARGDTAPLTRSSPRRAGS